MNNNNFTPEQSLELITKIINEARSKFQENGYMFIFWGILIATASFSQFFLLQNGFYEISWYPYFLMPAGAVVTGIYYSKPGKRNNKNQITRIVSISWVTLSVNIILLGFLFAPYLKENLIPLILILLSIGTLISAGAIKSNLLYFSGAVINISGIACFYLNRIYHPLLMGFIAVVAILIPGIILAFLNKKRRNV
jgi:hypothetical protein